MEKMEQKWADAGALGNLIIGILILIQAFIILGKVDPALTSIAVVPWMLVGIPTLLVVVIIQLRCGDIVGACANGIMGVVVLGQFIGNGIIPLLFLLTGKTPPPAYASGHATVMAMGFLLAAILLFFVGFLAAFQSGLAAIAVWCSAFGFLGVSAANFGLGPIFALLGGIGLLIIAVWLFYSGLAIMVNTAAQNPLMPMGKPLFTPK